MNDIILHHYAMSPYAEKIRAILGYKKLAWKSVTAPSILPKPDLIPLTGGYRKTPVMQIGRDIYCDTRLIVGVLDRIRPEPQLVPASQKASCVAFAQLESMLFLAGVSTAFRPEGIQAFVERMGQDIFAAFVKDRTDLFAGGTVTRPSPAFADTHFVPLMNAIDSQLADRAFLLGDAATLADFVAYHPIWFVLGNAGVKNRLDAFENIAAWMKRIRAFGHGTSSDLSSAEALEIARSSRENQPFDGPLVELEKAKVGQRVAVHAVDYGVDRVEGTLVHTSVFEIAVARSDERAGEVIVHFPRTDFKVSLIE